MAEECGSYVFLEASPRKVLSLLIQLSFWDIEAWEVFYCSAPAEMEMYTSNSKKN